MPSSRTRCRGNGCAGTTATRRTNTPIISQRAAASQTHSAGLEASGFEAWLEAARAKGAKHADPSPFPESGEFRASPPLPSTDR